MSSQKEIPKRNKNIVATLKELLKDHKTIGIVQMEAIGASTVQKLRSDLRKRARIVVAKNTLMRKALQESKIKGFEKLEEYVKGPSAFLFTNFSPYNIANYLDKNKIKAPAKSGQISSITVVVPKSNTGFLPGAIISELNAVGLPTRIEDGTVAIPQDTQVLAPGERVSTTLASILSRLNIEPFLVGLSMDVVLENGEIISHDELTINYDQYRNDIIFAHQSAVNLAVKAGILNSETAPMILSKANREAMALAVAIGYVTQETAPVVLNKARAQALALLKAVYNVDKSAVPAELASLVA